jgi:transcriptional activator of cad operon
MGVIQEKAGVPGEIAYGAFVIVPAACTIAAEGETVHLDPAAIAVLSVLAQAPGKMFTAAELEALAWPRGGAADVAKVAAKLYAVLEPWAPGAFRILPQGYVASAAPVVVRRTRPETTQRSIRIPDRWRPRPWQIGAAALAAIVLAVPAAALLTEPVRQDDARQAQAYAERADEDYFQYSFARNEQAIVLYQRAIRRDPGSARAHAGLANALVQRVMRWPQGDNPNAPSFTRLQDALRAGLSDQPRAQSTLRRAYRMAQRAVSLDPRDAEAHKALAFVHSAQRNFDDALNGYKRSVALDSDAWRSMMNIGDILEIQGRGAEAVPYFEKAYETMARVYGAQTVRVRPWHSELGIHIGDAYRARGELKQSVRWYRRVLDTAPLHPTATGRLTSVLHQTGDEKTARELCAALKSRLGPMADCKS